MLKPDKKKPGQTFPDRQTGPTPPQLSSRETMVKKLVARDAPTWQFTLTLGKGGLTSEGIFNFVPRNGTKSLYSIISL